MQKSFSLFLSIVLTCMACSSAPKKTETVDYGPPKIDYLEVQNHLGLDLAPGQTGFREKVFDACYLGDALKTLSPPLKDCHKAYYSLVQFQLSCRASEDTSAIFAASDLQAVANRKIRYNLGQGSGSTQTDYRGEATIRAISSGSQKRAYLRVSTGEDFLMMKAGDVTEIVTPPSWCVGQ